jgi:UDP-N-acetylglucosamine transferase subunit ALG13
MILVTVGTHDQQFNRLVKAADDLSLLIQEQVVIQRGISDYSPKHAQCFDFVSLSVMEDWIARSSIVIAQAGAGTVITVIKHKKPLILIPRLSIFGEHYNDHQLELATALESQKRALSVLEPTDVTLLDAITKVYPQTDFSSQQPSELVKALRQKLESWEVNFNWGRP